MEPIGFELLGLLIVFVALAAILFLVIFMFEVLKKVRKFVEREWKENPYVVVKLEGRFTDSEIAMLTSFLNQCKQQSNGNTEVFLKLLNEKPKE